MNRIEKYLLEVYINKNNINLDLVIDEFGYDPKYFFLENIGEYYKLYIILTQFQADLMHFFPDITEECVYYDRYYWFTMFVKKLELIGQCGEDIKQYKFQLFENLTNNMKNIDWNLLESIDKL